MARLSIPVVLVSIPFFTSIANAVSCYNPLGEQVTNDFQPCIAVDGIHSMCCGINRTSADIGNIDVCQTNGLCYHPKSNTYLLDSCSDPTWKSPSCLDKTLCPQVRGQKFLQMTHCPDGKWCCGLSNLTCCTDNKGFELKPNLVTFSTNNTQESLQTVTQTVQAPPVNTGQKNGQVKKDGTVKTAVLGGVAAGLTLLVFLGIAGGFWLGLQKGRGQQGGMEKYGQIGQSVAYVAESQNEYKGGVHEIGTDTSRPAELSTNSPR